MEKESNITWWKIALSIVGPLVLAVPAIITIVGFMVVLNFGWSQLGISQPIGYLYSLAVITLLLFILYATRRNSHNKRIWFALPLFTAVLLGVISVSTLGLSGMLIARLAAIALLVGLYTYIAWIIWTLLADI